MNTQYLTEHHSLNCYGKSNRNNGTPITEIIQMSDQCSPAYESAPARMKFADIFAGVGGFHLGLANSGGFECVFASELDEELRKLYRKNFDMDVHGDITKIDEKGDTRTRRAVCRLSLSAIFFGWQKKREKMS